MSISSGARRNDRHRRARRTASTILAVWLGFASLPAVASPAESMLDILQASSHADLGLGGDPFLSPLLCQTGWWHQELLDSGLPFWLDVNQYLPITRRLSGDESEVVRTRTRLGMQRSWQYHGRTLQCGLLATRGRASTQLEENATNLSLDENGQSFSGLVRLCRLAPGLDAQVAAPLGRSSADETREGLRYGLHFQWRERVHLISDWMRRKPGLSLTAVLENELVESPLNLNWRENNLGARFRLWRSLNAEFAVRESHYLPDQALTQAERFEFVPDASSVFHQQGLEWGTDGNLQVLVRHTEMDFSGRGNGYWGGQRYLRMDYFRIGLDSVLLGIQFPLPELRRLFLDLEFGKVESFGRIDVDSWRFASWQEAWLGAKKIMQLGGDGRWERYHVGGECPWKSWVAKSGLSWYELYPDVFYESWVHIALLPRRDYQRSTLPSSRYSLAAVSVGLERFLGRVFVAAAVHQFVYCDDHHARSSPSEPPEPPPGNEEVGRPQGWYGGTFAQLSLGYSY